MPSSPFPSLPTDPDPTLPAPEAEEPAAPEAEAAPGEEPAAPAAPAKEPAEAADGFSALGVVAPVCATLAGLGYEEPTPIQRAAIPPLLAGRDVLGEAPTGPGKTAAFALPLLQRLLAPPDPAIRRGTVRGLVLVPTRELAMQVADALGAYGASLGARILAIYGGQPIGPQLRVLARGVDVVVATPGRAVDHLTRGSLRLDAVGFVVLDEADEMLDMGFAEDLEAILSRLPTPRQTALFSATVAPEIVAIARRHLTDPERVRVPAAKSAAGTTISAIEQRAYVVRRPDKLAALCRILDVEDPTSALVFGRTRDEVDGLAQRLTSRGHDAAALHGGMSQDQRDRVMGRFRDGSLAVLVATDVAARGLDIEHVSHVVNHDVPTDPDAYTHRIGRTGRAGRTGVAITLLEQRENRLLRDIERATGSRIVLAQVPSVADLRERRLTTLRTRLTDAVARGDGERYRGLLAGLAETHDPETLALAAIALAEDAAGRGAEDTQEIPTLPLVPPPVVRERRTPPPFPGRPGPGAPRPGGPGGPPMQPGQGPGPEGWRPLPLAPGWARLWIGGGRRIGMRPGDLVGAIANEAGVPPATIGRILIHDAFSLAEVREEVAERVLIALTGARIRGRALAVRPDAGVAEGPRPPQGPPPPDGGPRPPNRPGPPRPGPRPDRRGPGPVREP
ncbi:MAG: DEAD/DEAH box helicase [Chloroflexota bacterium]